MFYFIQKYLTLQFLILLILFTLFTLFTFGTFIFKYNFIKTSYLKLIYFNLLVMSLIVYLGGLFITYVYPKQIIVSIDNYKYLIDNKHSRLFDIICHQIPHLLILIITLYLIYNQYLSESDFMLNKLLITLLWIVSYLLFINPFYIYFNLE